MSMMSKSKYTNEDLRDQGSRPMMAVKFQISYEMGGNCHNPGFRGVWDKIPQL